jgi:hypothetical protein
VNLLDDVGPAEHKDLAAALLAPVIVRCGLILLDRGTHRAVINDNALLHGLEKIAHSESLVIE